jgi:hypothetical protein
METWSKLLEKHRPTQGQLHYRRNCQRYGRQKKNEGECECSVKDAFEVQPRRVASIIQHD